MTLPALLAVALLSRPEATYTAAWCTARGGQVEVRLADGTRADCLTPTHAVEVERARRWYEAVGQALHYAQLTGRQPGIVLIVERPDDCRYLARLRAALARVRVAGRPIRVWTTGLALQQDPEHPAERLGIGLICCPGELARHPAPHSTRGIGVFAAHPGKPAERPFH